MALRYRARHLKPRAKRRGPVVLGTATSMWLGSSAAAYAGTHVVRPGDTLTRVADRYDTTVARLARLNRLSNPNLIVIGQRLRVPGAGSSGTAHRVRPGETLSAIAARYGVSVARIARANRIRDPNLIIAGTRLKVPGGRSPAPTGSASSHGSIGQSLVRQALDHGVDPVLVKSVAWLESGWHQRARSSAGAIGVMQVLKPTARYVNRVLGGHRLRIYRADDNIHLGVMYLRHMLRIMPSERKALAAYYSGPGNVGRRLDKGQRRYVRLVRALKARFR